MKVKKRSLFLWVFLVCFLLSSILLSGCPPKEKPPKSETYKPKPTKLQKPLEAEIKVDKTEAKPGEKLKYTIIIKNNTEKPFEGVKIKFFHPSGTSSEMVQEGGVKPSFDMQTKIWTWDEGVLQAKGSSWFTFALNILPDAPSGINITAKFDVEAKELSKPASSNVVVTEVK